MNSTTIELNGHPLEIPAGLATQGLSGSEINRYAGEPDGKITYEITEEGNRLVPPEEKTAIRPGARFGTMDRVVAGGQTALKERPVLDLASVDGINFEIPAGGALMLPNQIKTLALAEHKPMLYRVTDQGHEMTLPDQPLRVNPGDTFGTMDRVIAGGRNTHRINAELALLQRAYGPQQVGWTPNQEWVKLTSYRLPAGYNRESTELLVHVPDTYGLGVPIRECYVDTGLRFNNRGSWVKIPHYFDAEDSYRPREGVKQEGWGYFCLHCVEWGPRANFLTFLNAAYTVLSNPLFPWPTS